MDGFNRVCKKGYEMTYPNLTEEQSKRVQEFSRAQVEAMCTYIEAERRVTELERKNAKLREKLCDLWRFTKSACKKYPRLFDQSAQGGQTVQLNAIDAFEQCLQELGIEVEE